MCGLTKCCYNHKAVLEAESKRIPPHLYASSAAILPLSDTYNPSKNYNTPNIKHQYGLAM